MSLRLFMLAGEASGDQIGADLIKRLRLHTSLELNGVGGTAMLHEGLHSNFPITDLSVMGLVDVLRHLPLLLWRLHQSVNAVLRFDPDMVVLIDSQDFSAMLAKRLRKRGYTKPIILYVAPTVWVIRAQRAQKIKPLFDEVLAVLPFEPAFMVRLDGPPTSFVGHPALSNYKPDNSTRTKNKIALLPGSRMGELQRHLPMFAQAVDQLHAKYPDLEFFLPTLDHLVNHLKFVTSQWQVPVTIVTRRDERIKLYAETKLALVVSGTATLELAFAGVPFVVTYIMDWAQNRARAKIKPQHISLPNIILNQALVPELLLEAPDATALFAEVDYLLSHPEALSNQREGFHRLADLMITGTTEYPRQDPAKRVLAHASPQLLKSMSRPQRLPRGT